MARLGTDIARDIIINPDQYGSGTPSGYMLDGYGKLWPFGNAVPVTSPQFGFDIARGVTLLPKTITTNPGGYVLDGYGGMHPFGNAPAITNAATFGFDIARGVTSWTAATTCYWCTSSSYLGGWVIDGYGGLHPYQSAPAVGSGGAWPGWDIARADTGSGAGSGAR